MVMSDLGLEIDAFVVVVLGGIDVVRVKGWGGLQSEYRLDREGWFR